MFLTKSQPCLSLAVPTVAVSTVDLYLPEKRSDDKSQKYPHRQQGLTDAKFVAKLSQPMIKWCSIENYTLELDHMSVTFAEEDLQFLHPNVKQLYVFEDFVFDSFVFFHVHHTQI